MSELEKDLIIEKNMALIVEGNISNLKKRRKRTLV